MKPLAQVVVFVALVFAVPWVVGPFLPQQPQNTWETILSYLPGVWAPTVIALIMILATRGVPSLRHELSERFRIAPASGVWLVGALTIPAVVTATGLLIARAAGDRQSFIPASVFGIVVLNASTTGAVGEELGWRGFVLSRLNERMSPPASAIVMAALWTLWHLPIFLFPDSPYASWPLVPALLTIMAFGLLMATLFHRAQGSIVPTIVAHLSLNVSLGVGGVQLSSDIFWWVLAAMFLLIAALNWRVLNRGPQPAQKAVDARSPFPVSSGEWQVPSGKCLVAL